MTGEDIDDETYSLIFRSLKHPIRRRILRMLTGGPKAFSEILGILDIDSGHLSYHLGNLGELVSHTPEGRYKLSSIGVAATGLMSGVEEQTSRDSTFSAKQGILKAFIAVCFILLLLTSLFGSIYFYNHTEQWSGEGSSTWIPRPTPPNGTVNFNLTIVYKEEHSFSHEDGPGYFYTEVRMPVETPMTWTRDELYWTLHINGTGAYRIREYDPDGQLIDEDNFEEDPESESQDLTSYINVWNKPGTYRMIIDWIKSDKIREASLDYGHTRYWCAKPHYNYGIAGLLISIGCPMTVIVLWAWTTLTRSS